MIIIIIRAFIPAASQEFALENGARYFNLTRKNKLYMTKKSYNNNLRQLFEPFL